MKNYFAEETKLSPYIELNAERKQLIFRGQSYPENAYRVYEPVFHWVDQYFSRDIRGELIVNFELSYINTSSTKCLLMLFEKLDEAYRQGAEIQINWNYDEGNGFDYEMGQDFKEDVELPFRFIARNR